MNFSFEDFQPMMYPVRIGFGNAKGNKGEGDVSINNRPFILQKITHQLVNPKPEVSKLYKMASIASIGVFTISAVTSKATCQWQTQPSEVYDMEYGYLYPYPC